MKDRNFILAIAVAVLTVLMIPTVLHAQDDAAQAKKAQHHHYKLIDVGTFGGPSSYLNETESFAATMLDSHGVLVGGADTALPDPFPNFCFTDCFVVHAFRTEENGELTDLGALPGGGSSMTQGMSRSGLIAGLSENGQTDPLLPGEPEVRAVLWQNGGITDLGTLEGGYESLASAVNSRGEVVGMFTNTTPDPNSLFGNGYQARAFLWQQGVMQDLGTLGGTDAQAFLINDRGQIVGWSYTSSVSLNCGFGLSIATGSFIWDKQNGMRDLGGLGGLCTTALDMNDRGQIVGASDFKGDTTAHGFLWDGSIHDLGGSLGGSLSQANAINQRGETVGIATLAGDVVFHAVLWKRVGQMTDLGTILPGDSTFAAGINSKTQVVGTETYPNGAFSAFLWENGSIVDLNTLVTTGSQLTLMFPLDINDRGEIAFNPTDANGNAHAVLLIPCDDDHPNVEGCDYNMVDASTLAARVSPTPEKSSSAPPNYVSPGFGRSGNPMQRRFGGRFGPWNQGMGAERPALKPTSAPPTDGTPEHSPLCSQGSNGQSGAEDAKLPVTDSFTFHGVCHVNYINNLLDGRCVAPVDGEICRYKSDAQQCPAGAKAIRPAWVTISFNCKSVRVDLARPCSFNY